MSNEKKEICAPIKNISYFSYFNHKLYDNQIYTQYEDDLSKANIDTYQSTEESSSNTNTSDNSIISIENEDKFIPLNLLDLSPTKALKTNNKIISNGSETKVKDKDDTINSQKQAIKPELQKYILPKYLFDSSKNKKIENNNNISTTNQSYSASYINNLNICTAPFNPKIKVVPVILVNNPSLCLNYNKYNYLPNNMDYTHSDDGKKKKKKKKEFVEREGDWPCYRCKNLNFAFRDKCNKCQMTKDESEKKFNEVGEELLKLADLSIYNKS